jgi:hypothetical protein
MYTTYSDIFLRLNFKALLKWIGFNYLWYAMGSFLRDAKIKPFLLGRNLVVFMCFFLKQIRQIGVYKMDGDSMYQNVLIGMIRLFLGCLLLSLVLIQCNRETPQDLFDPASQPYDPTKLPQYTDGTEAAGLPVDIEAKRITVLDVDGDHNVDIMINGSRLFKGNGDGTFTEITDTVFPDGAPTADGAVWADVDNDGDLDMYAFLRQDAAKMDWTVNPDTQANTLWINDNGVLSEAPASSLPDLTTLAGKHAFGTTGVGWADYDQDGFVDLAVANFGKYLYCCEKDNWTTEGDPPEPITYEFGNTDFLFHNTGGTFEDATSLILDWWSGTYPIRGNSDAPAMEIPLSGGSDPVKNSYGLNWGDGDNDGDQDLYVSNYRLARNFYFVNEGGTFQEFALYAKCAGAPTNYNGYKYYGHTVGSAWGDYNNDGFLDILICNLSHPGDYQYFSDNSQLFKNLGTGYFEEVHEDLGIAWRIGHANPAWGDFNNDGALDMFMGVMYYPGIGEPQHFSDIYFNQFTGFYHANASIGIPDRNDWSGIFADVDNDGFLDLLAGGNYESKFTLYLNKSASSSNTHWIKILLKGNGTSCNTAAIGSRITIPVKGNSVITREVNAGFGSGNQHPLIQHFGIGTLTKIHELTIRWADGSTQTVTDLPADQLHIITQN